MTSLDSPALTGAHNFRSLAGMPTADGRTIKPHALMRSARLARLTVEDWQVLQGLGLRTICDLRGTSEVAVAPTSLPSHLPVRLIHFDIRNDVRSDRTLAESLRNDPTPAGARRLMLEIYARFPRAMAPRLKELFDILIDGEDGAPLLIHCTAGKDRTGFLVALLLHALDVPFDAARADYLKVPESKGLADPRLAQLKQHFNEELGLDLPLATIVPVLGVEDEYLDAAWAALERDHGGVDSYLMRHAGLDSSRLERLRARFLS